MPLIRHLLRILPARLASSVCYRLFSRNAAAFSDYFDDAPLRYAPGLRMRLNRGDWAHVSIAFMGAYELPVTRLVIESARRHPAGVMVDVGANFGYFSLLWAAQNPGNRVVAFEPSAANLAALRGNIDRNGLGPRIRTVAAAVGRQAGEVRFAQNLEQSGWSRIVTDQSPSTAVPMVTLDEQLASETSPIALLKIDTEGHDWEVLAGCIGLLSRRKIARVVFECDAAEFHGPLGRQWAATTERLGLAFRSIDAADAKDGLMTCLIEAPPAGPAA
jgi:FkbM family methyltransferase